MRADEVHDAPIRGVTLVDPRDGERAGVLVSRLDLAIVFAVRRGGRTKSRRMIKKIVQRGRR